MIQEIDEGCDVFFEVYGIDAEKKASDLKWSDCIFTALFFK